MTEIIGFSGSLSTPSRTRTLVEMAVEQSAALSQSAGGLVDLTDLGQDFGAARRLADLSPRARKAAGRLIAPDAIVVGSPVYKGSYTGLFKHLFDLIDPDALKGKPVLLTVTGGGPRHALVIEHQLRPLFGFFEAAVVPTGVYAASGDFADGRPAAPELLRRLEEAAAQLARAIRDPMRSGTRDLAVSAA